MDTKTFVDDDVRIDNGLPLDLDAPTVQSTYECIPELILLDNLAHIRRIFASINK